MKVGSILVMVLLLGGEKPSVVVIQDQVLPSEQCLAMSKTLDPNEGRTNFSYQGKPILSAFFDCLYITDSNVEKLNKQIQ